MSTKLDRLLESLAPQRTLDETSARVDQAVNSFGLRGARVETWTDFTACLGAFYRHVENHVLRLGSFQASPEIDWGRAQRVLVAAYGASGPRLACELARTGAEGGLYAVLRKVAEQMVQDYGAHEVAARVGRFWQELTTDEKLAAAGEYLSKYGYLLPQDVVAGGAAGLWPHFPRVLEQHPHLLRRLRRLPR
jgi:hypothetical protein